MLTSVLTRRHQNMRRLFEAAKRDGNVNQFYDDILNEFMDRSTNLNDFSIRQLFEHLVDDGHELVRYHFTEARAGGSRLIEAAGTVDTSAFANIMGQYMYTATLKAYKQPTLIGDLLVDTEPTVFNGERVPGVGRIGDAVEVVNEGKPYPSATFGEEWVDTPETIKRGLILNITKEAIFFDRTGEILKRANAVGTEIAVNREKRILDVVCGISTIYRRNGGAAEATYQSDNTAASNALADFTNFNTAEQKFNAMTDPTSGELVMIEANVVLVPKALLPVATAAVNTQLVRRVTNSATVESEASGNLIERSLTPVSGQYVKQRTSSDTTWFYGNPKEAFGYKENWPITVVNTPENSELDFTSDIVFRSKVSERGAPYVQDRRKMVKCTA